MDESTAHRGGPPCTGPLSLSLSLCLSHSSLSLFRARAPSVCVSLSLPLPLCLSLSLSPSPPPTHRGSPPCTRSRSCHPRTPSWRGTSRPQRRRLRTYTISSRLKDLLGPVTRVKKKKRRHHHRHVKCKFTMSTRAGPIQHLTLRSTSTGVAACAPRDFFIDNLLVRIHFIILMIM